MKNHGNSSGFEWIVTPQESGVKLLAFLVQHFEGKYSARFLKRVIDHHGCRINGKTEHFASTLLGKGDHVYLHLAEDIFSDPHQIEPSRILYEDDVLFVYNKPPWINSDEKGILSILQKRSPSLKLVHRLDRETTGVLLLVKEEEGLQRLIDQFKQFQVQKRYLAIVDGKISQSRGSIENYLGKKRPYAGQTIWGAVSPSKGLYACTEWQRLKTGKNASLVACVPKTGRTHQIRVHMAEMGHPVLGDFQYGEQFQCPYHPSRYLLHAEEMVFPHPLTGKLLQVIAPLPDDFQAAQRQLFKG